MKYTELKEKQQKEVNQFPFGFAFDNKQFDEMMVKFNLQKTDLDKIYSLGAGTFIRKVDALAMEEMFKRHKEELLNEIEKDTSGNNFIYEMFAYELANHEFGLTYDFTDTLDALGLTIEQIDNNKNLKAGFEKAVFEYYAEN